MKKKWSIGWGITSRCNMKCKFCYSSTERINSQDLKLKDWIKFVDQNHDMIEAINYGTGENTLIDDWFKLIDYIREKYPNIEQAVTTNGYLAQRIIENKELKKIFTKSIDEVDVSLDFADKEKHSELRGQKYAYDWAIAMLELLKESNKKATIVFLGTEEVLEKQNLDNLFLIAKKYSAILRMNIYRPVNPDEEINKKFNLSYDKLIKTIEYVNKKYKILSLSDSLLNAIFEAGNEVIDATGVSSLRILPDGSITPSTYLISGEFKAKNIKEDNVLDGLKFDIINEILTPDNCVGCKYENTCNGGVIDRRMLTNKTLNSQDPYCPFIEARALPKKIHLEKNSERISVHDGYLPTLFFTNK